VTDTLERMTRFDTAGKKIAAEPIRDVSSDSVGAGPLRIARYSEPFALLVGELAYGGKKDPQLAYWFSDSGMGVIMSELALWGSFYAIVGSAAGALIGLQFVVMTLIAQRPPIPAAEARTAFGTPTIVHFSAALLLSALSRVPWLTITIPAILWGLMGFSGVVYAVIVGRRMRKQHVYLPDFEDWLFHLMLPLVAYVLLGLSPFAVHCHIRETLFGVGAATLLLLLIGIHNAWDAVAYHVFVHMRDTNSEQHRDKTSGNESQ
jgi:hypothetical protein